MAVMDSKLFGKVVQREERMTRVETLLVFLVAAFHFAVMARCVWTNELMSGTKFRGSGLKQGRQISSAVGEAIGERKAIVCLDAFYSDPPPRRAYHLNSLLRKSAEEKVLRSG